MHNIDNGISDALLLSNTTPHLAHAAKTTGRTWYPARLPEGPIMRRHCLAAHRRYFSRCLDLPFEACRHGLPKAVEGVGQKTGRNSVSAATGLVVETNSSQDRRGPNDEIRSQSWRHLPGRCPRSLCAWFGRSAEGQALTTRGAWPWPCHRSRADPRTRSPPTFPKDPNQTAPTRLVVHNRQRTGCLTKCRGGLELLTISMTRSRLLGRTSAVA